MPALLELLCDLCLLLLLKLAPLLSFYYPTEYPLRFCPLWPKLNRECPFDFCWLAVVVMFPAFVPAAERPMPLGLLPYFWLPYRMNESLFVLSLSYLANFC